MYPSSSVGICLVSFFFFNFGVESPLSVGVGAPLSGGGDGAGGGDGSGALPGKYEY